MLKDFEKLWLKDKVSLDKVVIPEELNRKAILFNLYSDKFTNDFKKGVQFVFRSFPSTNSYGNWQTYFDMIVPDYENETFYFFYFINSNENSTYENMLIGKLTNLVRLFKNLNDDSNEWLDFIFKGSIDVQEIMEELINNPEATKKILIFDLGEYGNEQTIKSISRKVNLSDFDIDILNQQLYKDKVLESLEPSIFDDKLSNRTKTVFTFNYYDSNISQTKNGDNRNFIKYISTGNLSNYIFSFTAKSLVNAYRRFDGQILERNIRYGLMNEGKQVNEGITNTIKETPKDFWVLNNGLTIIAEKININEVDKTVKLEEFQIVNGAQTITNMSSVVKKDSLDVLEDVFVPTKIIIVGENKNEEILEKQIGRIVRSANNQKAVKDRDLVSNDKNMKELKTEFKKFGIVLNIKRGDKDYTDRLDKIDIAKEFGNIKIETVNNDEIGKEIISLIMQNPSKALQVKNKIFNSENYSKVFKNENINFENIVYVHKFKKNIEDLINDFFDNEELSFNKLANTSIGNNEELENRLENLYKHAKTWITSMIYYVIYLNQNQNNNLILLNLINEEQNKKFESSWYKSLFLVNNEKLIISDYPTTEFKKALLKLVEGSLIEMNEIYLNSLKDKTKLNFSTFSFTRDYYTKFLSIMYRRYDPLFILILKEIL